MCVNCTTCTQGGKFTAVQVITDLPLGMVSSSLLLLKYADYVPFTCPNSYNYYNNYDSDM